MYVLRAVHGIDMRPGLAGEAPTLPSSIAHGEAVDQGD